MYNQEKWRATHTNGKISLTELREIVPPQYDPDLKLDGLMHPDAARAMTAFLYAAASEGHSDLRTKYTYRTLAVQWEKWYDYQNGGNLAAYPGTSNHGWAVSADLSWAKADTIAWAHNNAQRFGFKFDVPSENWHVTYQDGDIRPAVLTMEADMTKADDIEKGILAYLAGTEPTQEGLARKTYRALDKAANLPKPGTPGPHSHEGTVKVT